MNSKLSQKGWMSVVIWAGLLAATAYTSNATVNVFVALYQNLFQILGTGISSLFSNPTILTVLILGIVLLFLLVSAWLGLVSFGFEVGEMIFGEEEEGDEQAEAVTALIGQTARYLGFSWGLFLLIFLIIPFASQV